MKTFSDYVRLFHVKHFFGFYFFLAANFFKQNVFKALCFQGFIELWKDFQVMFDCFTWNNYSVFVVRFFLIWFSFANGFIVWFPLMQGFDIGLYDWLHSSLWNRFGGASPPSQSSGLWRASPHKGRAPCESPERALRSRGFRGGR